MSGSIVTCPNCHQDSVLRGVMRNVQIWGSGGKNVAVTCTHCGREFDAAPGGHVRVDTVGGRLRSVAIGARLLLTEATQDPTALDQLINVLREQPAAASSTQVADEIDARTGSAFAQFTDWLRDNQWITQWLAAAGGVGSAGVSLAAFILTLLTSLGGGQKPPTSVPQTPAPVVVQVPPSLTGEQIEDMIRRAVQEQACQDEATRRQTVPGTGEPTPRAARRRPGRAPTRNLPCPCGSGTKYKRCCGAP